MALLVGAPLAFADHGTIHDKVGDVKFNPPGKKADYDITRASWSVKRGRFIHTVSPGSAPFRNYRSRSQITGLRRADASTPSGCRPAAAAP